MRRRVVITGMGIMNALGIGREAYFSALCRGDIGIDRIQSFDASGFPSQVAGECPPFKLRDYVPKAHRKAIKLMSRDIALAVITADAAFRDAGLKTKGTDPDGPATIDPVRSGVNLGSGLISYDLTELGEALANGVEEGQFSYPKWGKEGMESLTPIWLLKFLPNMLSCHVSIIHDLQGPSNSITCGEASGQLAISEAYRTIAHGKADVMAAGGAESKVNPMKVIRQYFMKTSNTLFNDRPKEACRPFDCDAAGEVVGEGAGIVILEELEHARRRNATIYAELKGVGTSTTFSEDFIKPESEGKGISIALECALKRAGLKADQIGLLVPTGQGVLTHDRAEASAIRRVFGEGETGPAVFATKSQIGHCGAGAGAIDLMTAVLAMGRKVIPQMQNCPNPQEGCGLNFTQSKRVGIEIDHVATCCYGFGGQTAAIVAGRL